MNQDIRKNRNNKSACGIWLAFGILAMSVLLSGCGAEETSSIAPENLVEAIPEEETAAEAENDVAVSDAKEKPSTTSGHAGYDPTAPTTETKTISTSALEALAETENLTEEKRKELLVQSLVDAGKDPSLAEGKIKTKRLSFEVPEDFAPYEKNKNMYVTRRYSLDISNIYYEERNVDYLMQLMDEEAFKSMALQEIKSTYGLDIDLKIDSFEEKKISGIPSFVLESHFELEGIQIKQTTYIVNADKTYILIYTLTNEYDHDAEFEASQQSIRVEKQWNEHGIILKGKLYYIGEIVLYKGNKY